MIPFFFTIPISMNMPTKAYRDASCPNTTSVSKPPNKAVDRVDQLAERHQTLSVIGLDIQLRQVLGIGPRRVFHLENNLVLVFRFLDQVKIVLRISVTQQRQDSRLRHSVSFRLLAPQFNIEIW